MYELYKYVNVKGRCPSPTTLNCRSVSEWMQYIYYVLDIVAWERKHLTRSRVCHLLSIKVNCINIVVGFFTISWISNEYNYMQTVRLPRYLFKNSHKNETCDYLKTLEQFVVLVSSRLIKRSRSQRLKLRTVVNFL